jgi:hypothetical protein
MALDPLGGGVRRDAASRSGIRHRVGSRGPALSKPRTSELDLDHWGHGWVHGMVFCSQKPRLNWSNIGARYWDCPVSLGDRRRRRYVVRADDRYSHSRIFRTHLSQNR